MTLIETTPPITIDVAPGRPPFWSTTKAVALALSMALVGAGIGFASANKSTVSKPGPVDIGFVRDMMDHHDQAVEMANLVLSAGSGARPVVSGYAREVITWQRWEEGWMEAWLQEWKVDREPDRPTVMGWMGMAMSPSEMPGLQSETNMQELATSKGAKLDERFLTMMREHHLGGVAMADYAAKWAKKDKVAGLAATMAKNQRFEIADYEKMMATLGITVPPVPASITHMARMSDLEPPKA